MRRFSRILAVGMAVTIFSTGCMLSRAVDRAFLGVSVRRPQYDDRKTTGLFLLPFAFAIDLVTSPIQAILIVILGDQFPFNDVDTLQRAATAMRDNPQFQKLNDAQRATALAEFNQILQSGSLTPNTVLSLTEDGHWTMSDVSNEVREQMIARAGASSTGEVVVSR